MNFLSSLQVATDGLANPTTSLLVATQGKAPAIIVVVAPGAGRPTRRLRDEEEPEEVPELKVDDEELLILL